MLELSANIEHFPAMANTDLFLQRMDAIFLVAPSPEPCTESNPAQPEGLGLKNE